MLIYVLKSDENSLPNFFYIQQIMNLFNFDDTVNDTQNRDNEKEWRLFACHKQKNKYTTQVL